MARLKVVSGQWSVASNPQSKIRNPKSKIHGPRTANREPIVILGIDPGLRVSGYGAIRVTDGRCEVIEGGAIRPPATAALADRLREIRTGLMELMDLVHPDAVVVEEVYSKYDHPKTAILMGHARGVILCTAAECGVPVIAYTASTVKRALTGSGRASKAQIQRMVQATLGLGSAPRPADVADAFALALCHARRLTDVRCRMSDVGCQMKPIDDQRSTGNEKRETRDDR